MSSNDLQNKDHDSHVERIESDGSAASQISLQAYQAAYNEITGKTEEITREYSPAYQIKFEDLEQLNIKVEQLCEQYTLIEANCNITVFHQEDTKDRFSSFDRFKLYNSSNTSPVESVLIEYNFLIHLPKLRKPQPYKLSLRLASGIVVHQQMRKKLPPGLIKIIGGATAKVSIEYVDYMLARNIIGAIDEWFKTLNISSSAAPIVFLRKHSRIYPALSKYGLLFFSSYISFALIGKYIPEEAFSPRVLTEFILGSFLLLFISYRLGIFLGTKLQEALDATDELSYICLNRGDEKQIEEIKKRNRSNLIVAYIAFLGNFAAAIFASAIANFISK